MTTAGQSKEMRSSLPRRTRLIVDVTPEMRRRIKVGAARNDLSIREYVERILEQAVPADDTVSERSESDATRQAEETYARLLAARERINQGQVFSDSVEIIREMREERDWQLEGQ